MFSYKRNHFSILLERLRETRRFIQVISGPRQIGKTTLISQVLEETLIPHYFISADAVPESSAIWLEQQWETARFRYNLEETKEFLLVIDEIQKIENWSEQIKRHWDQDTRNGINIKLVILGSARLLIQQGLTESLAGRFELIPMNHWSFLEMETAFGLTAEQYIWFGGYPGAIPLLKDESRWRDYILHSLIETSIAKDVLMLTSIRKPALLKKLFELACTYSGQILSFNKIMGQLQEAGNASTLSHYLQLLDSAGLITGLEKVYKEQVRSKASSPKFQVLNTALISAYAPYNFDKAISSPQDWGRHVESGIGAHLANATRDSEVNLYYWREGNYEVDFVLEKNGTFIGLEVKSGAGRNTQGMKRFADKFNPQKLLLVGREGIPWQAFLKTKPEDLF